MAFRSSRKGAAETDRELRKVGTSVVDLAFALWRGEYVGTRVKSKTTLETDIFGVPLVLTLVNALALTRFECQNRATVLAFETDHTIPESWSRGEP
jgi:hypothetical protein